MRGVGRRRNVCCIGFRLLVEGGIGSVCAYSCFALQPWNAEYVAEDSCLHEFDGFARLAAGLKGVPPVSRCSRNGRHPTEQGISFLDSSPTGPLRCIWLMLTSQNGKICAPSGLVAGSRAALFSRGTVRACLLLWPLVRAAATSGYSCSARRSSAAPTNPANRGCGRVGRLLNSG